MSRQTAGKRPAQSEAPEKTIGRGLSFAASEAYRLLRTNILFALPDEQKCRIIGVTSSLSGEGKSTTALNLAYMLAEAGRRALLVETDMRLPTIAGRLGLEGGQGLSNLLAGLCGVEDAVQPSGIHDDLLVVSSGDIPPNPSELLGSRQMGVAVEKLAGLFDFIVLDLPPVNEVADALVVSRITHGMLMVVRQDYATRASVAEAMRQLEYVGAKVLGFVMTRTGGQGGKYRGYKKYSYYGYGGPAGEASKG